MKRPTLRLAPVAPRPRRPSLALAKKAIRLFRAPGIAKAVYRANARKWLASMAALGDNHILNHAAPAKWGRPGHPNVRQLVSPRRIGEQP